MGQTPMVAYYEKARAPLGQGRENSGRALGRLQSRSGVGRWLGGARAAAAAIFALALAGPGFAQLHEPHTYALQLEGGRAATNPPVMRTILGATVHIGWLADRPVEIVLEGHDVRFKAGPADAYTLRLVMTKVGRFAFQADGDGYGRRPVAYLDIAP